MVSASWQTLLFLFKNFWLKKHSCNSTPSEFTHNLVPRDFFCFKKSKWSLRLPEVAIIFFCILSYKIASGCVAPYLQQTSRIVPPHSRLRHWHMYYQSNTFSTAALQMTTSLYNFLITPHIHLFWMASFIIQCMKDVGKYLFKNHIYRLLYKHNYLVGLQTLVPTNFGTKHNVHLRDLVNEYIFNAKSVTFLISALLCRKWNTGSHMINCKMLLLC